MPSETPAAASSDSDNLRRSKRRKFRLDVVAAAHGNNQKRHRGDPNDGDEEKEDPPQQLPASTDPPAEEPTNDKKDEDYVEETSISKRRQRRSTAKLHSYQEEDWVEVGEELEEQKEEPEKERRCRKCHKKLFQMNGRFKCDCCPSNYESRSSLSNHSKMHNGDCRRFHCELCNFNSNTEKTISTHQAVHGEDSGDNKNDNNNIASSAPQLVAASEEPFVMREEEEMGVSPPPILEREDSTDSPPLLERQVSTTPVPSSRQSSVESVVVANVRKSNRSVKPPKKITPTHTPKKSKSTKRTRSETKPRELTPQISGSLSNSLTSSTSSSVTPPPKSSPPSPPAKREKISKATATATTSEAPEEKPVVSEKSPEKKPVVSGEPSVSKPKPENDEKKARRRRHCPHCPFTATSITRLNRHSGGHRLSEGFECPAEGCNYLCRTAGFLQRHYTVHKEKLPWPPRYVTRTKEKKVVKKTKRTMQQAQIKSHKKVRNGSDGVAMQCNVGDCQFQTLSLTQLVIHKSRAHQAQEAFPLHKFLCLKCGHRAKSFADLRVHKLTRHISTSRRYHRTFYLKEMVGDKFFINHYTEENDKIEELDESDDESFDVTPSANGVSPEALNNIEDQSKFCCNICPYEGSTMNRIQRHYVKHSTLAEFKCSYCTWYSRSKAVLDSHEKLHLAAGQQLPGTSSEGVKASNGKILSPSADMFKCASTVPLAERLKAWCIKEKAAFPEMEDPVLRIFVDGVKAFRCIDCPYTSKYRGDMRSHKKRHDVDQTFRCVQCTYTTNRPVSLKDHMKQHVAVNDQGKEVKPKKLIVNDGVHIGFRHGIGRERIYRCHKCPYVTVSFGCLWRHNRNHRNTPKFYVCSICSYSSIDIKKMDEHLLIHQAMGPPLEQTPFVKRVDPRGNPVNTLTDFITKEERKAGKRKLAAAAAAAAAGSPAKDSGEKDEKPKPEKRARKGSKEPSSSSESPPPKETRPQVSERTTRSSNNYQFMTTRHFKALPPPDKEEIAEMERLVDIKMDQPMERSHFKIRETLGLIDDDKPFLKCPDCPYKTKEKETLDRHAHFHLPVENERPYQCSDCSFGAFTASAILSHVRLHDDGIEPEPVHKRAKGKKGEMIPAGTTVTYACRSCPFRTANNRTLAEHMAMHRYNFVNRVQMNMKRQGPKEEYLRPKHKYPPVVRNAKYCQKCTFKTTSYGTYIEHLDRHSNINKTFFKCHLCSYSDKNKSLIEYHQNNHHVMKDTSVHTVHGAMKYRLDSGAIEQPEANCPKPTAMEMAKRGRCLLRCRSCEFFCHQPQELAFHMSVNHLTEPGAREMISLLSQGLRPDNAEITAVSDS